MKRLSKLGILLGGLALLPACGDLTVPDYNNPSIEELEDNPTRTGVITAAQGLLIGGRAGISAQPGYVAHLGILGRESYTFDNSDPRYVDEMVAGTLDPGNGAFGGSGWGVRYSNLRNATIILNAVEKAPGFTGPETEAIRGFVKTIQALDFLHVVNMRDTNGGVIDVNRPIGADPAPLVGKDAMLQHVSQLLDEANAHLANAGGSFPFGLSPGFAGFDRPSTFREFNRALKARVEVYRGNPAEALAALGQSFLDPQGDLAAGVYHSYSTGAGDQTNGLFNPAIVAHPSIRTDAERKADGTLDDRVLAKTQILAQEAKSQGLATNVGFTIYTSPSAAVPIIRNEELILLRAEANLALGNRAAAAEDINRIRIRSGGLEPIADLASRSSAEILDELLEQRRFSLLLEGHRWIDMRRHGRLGELPLDRANDRVAERFPIPTAECLARGGAVPCGA